MQTPAVLRLGFAVGLAVAIAGRWINSWSGALAVVVGVGVMLYSCTERGSRDGRQLTTLDLN